MKYAAIITALGALSLACGGTYNPDGEQITWDDIASVGETEDAELGQLEQAYTSQMSPAGSGSPRLWTGVQGQTGLLTDACHTSQNNSTICNIPRTKTVHVVTLNLSCSTSEYNQFKNDLFSIVNEMALVHLPGSGWSFAVNSQSTFYTIGMNCSSASASGTDITDYVFVQPIGSIDVLSEPFQGSWVTTLPNQFFGEMQATIRHRALNTLGASPQQDAQLRRHGMAHALQKALGNGAQNLATGAHATQTFLVPGVSVALFSAGELCRTRNYVTGGSAFFVNASAGCPNY